MYQAPARSKGRKQERYERVQGFTLVEILIVVVILGILAGIVIPQFNIAASESRDSATSVTVYRIRQQIQIYRQQHSSEWPSFAAFEAQMAGVTDVSGNAAAAGTPGSFGPYIERLPLNPKTGTKVVGTGAVGSSDWYYDESNGSFHANDSAESFAY